MSQINYVPTRSKSVCLFLAAIVACSLLGCGDANRNRLVGEWGIAAPEKLMNRIDQAENSNDLPDQAEVSSRMVLQFERNGVLKTRTRMGDVDQEKAGTWEMISFDEASNLMSINCQINMQNSEHEITFVDDRTIKLVPPNMAGLSMKLKFSKLDGL